MGNASLLEILWTSIAIVGAVYSVGNLVEARRDFAALMQSGHNGILKLLANQQRRNQAERTILLCGFATIGVLACGFPNTPGPYTPARVVMASLFIALELRVTYGSWADHEDRQDLMR